MKNQYKYLLVFLIALVFVLGFYFGIRPLVASQYATKAINIYLDHRDTDNNKKFDLALSYIENANRWGRDNTNLGILKGQLLIKLGRYDDAKKQLETVKENDSSAIMAVDEILATIPE